MKNITSCCDAIRKITDFKPEIGIVLGSGLGDYADTIRVAAYVDYKNIPGFPVSTVQGHKGRFVFGYIEDIPVVIMQGRVHLYEDYSMEQVVLPIRIMKLLGINKLLLTNAAGGINYNFNAGDFMVIRDHISSLVPSPLIGKNLDELGTRFPDMSQVYDKELAESVKQVGRNLNIDIKEGVYIQLSGPNFETPAEIRMCRILGADAVGMSTACEAMAANHTGIRVCGISCISNLACGMSNTPLTHLEVQEMADRKSRDFKALVTAVILSWRNK